MSKVTKNQNVSSPQQWKVLLSELEETLIRNDRRFNLIQKMDREIQKTAENSDATFHYILNKGIEELKADYGHIVSKLNNESVSIKFSNCVEDVGRVMPINESFCGSVFTSGKLSMANDVEKLSKHQYFPLHFETKSELALPILDSRGVKNFGILNIEWKKKNQITDDVLNFCHLLTGQIAIAMEQSKLWQGVQFISELSNDLLVNLKSPEDVYAFILDRVLELLDFKLGQILLVNGETLLIVASSNKNELHTTIDKDSVCGYYVFEKKGKEPLNIPDLDNDSEYTSKYKWFLGKEEDISVHMKSEFVAPLIDKYNNIVGVINIEDPRLNAFSTFDTFIINIFGKMIMSAIEASNERKKMQDMENMQKADLSLANQGHMAVVFLHNFGGKIGNAKVRLAEFKRQITLVNDILPTFSGISSLNFIEGILQNLRDAGELARNFSTKMESAKNQEVGTSINLLTYIDEAVSRLIEKMDSTIAIEFAKDSFVKRRTNVEALLTGQFAEVLDFILNNAAEAMPNGGKIDINLTFSGLSSARLTISDSGIGMDKDTLERIFDPGYTTKKDISKRLGEGLGLWFVKSYLERFSASVLAQSIPNVGTTFTLIIPIKL